MALTNTATDDFEGTEGAELSAYSGVWTKAPTVTGDAEIASGRLRASSTTSASYYHSQVPASANYTVGADVYRVDSDAGNIQAAVTARQSTSANTLYRLGAYRQNTTQITLQVFRFIAGTATQIGANQTLLQGSGSTLPMRLEVSGSTVKAIFNGVEVISQTDGSPITAAGRAGVRFFSEASPSDTIGHHLASWYLEEDISGGGAPTVTALTPTTIGATTHRPRFTYTA